MAKRWEGRWNREEGSSLVFMKPEGGLASIIIKPVPRKKQSQTWWELFETIRAHRKNINSSVGSLPWWMSETPASLSWSDTHSYGNGVIVLTFFVCRVILPTPFGRGQSKPRLIVITLLIGMSTCEHVVTFWTFLTTSSSSSFSWTSQSGDPWLVKR